MKGIAILGVMVGHTYWLPEAVRIGVYAFHIPLFFIIAGYFAKTWEKGTGWQYMRLNAKRLLLPYLITAAVCCCYGLFRALYNHDWNMVTHTLVRYLVAMDHTWPGTLFDIWVAPIWFLLALFWGRIIFFYISRLGRWTLPVCVVLSGLMVFLHPYIPLPLGLGWSIEALVFMAVGRAYRQYGCPLWLKIIAVACCALSMYLDRIDICAFTFHCWPVDVLGACGGTLLVYYLSKGIARSFMRPFFVWCGQHSLAILCIHNIAMDITAVHWLNRHLPFSLPVKVYHCFKHLFTLCFAWAFSLIRKSLTP